MRQTVGLSDLVAGITQKQARAIARGGRSQITRGDGLQAARKLAEAAVETRLCDDGYKTGTGV